MANVKEDETVRHFIMECPTQLDLREKIRLKSNKYKYIKCNLTNKDLIYRWICEKRTMLII